MFFFVEVVIARRWVAAIWMRWERSVDATAYCNTDRGRLAFWCLPTLPTSRNIWEDMATWCQGEDRTLSSSIAIEVVFVCWPYQAKNRGEGVEWYLGTGMWNWAWTGLLLSGSIATQYKSSASTFMSCCWIQDYRLQSLSSWDELN